MSAASESETLAAVRAKVTKALSSLASDIRGLRDKISAKRQDLKAARFASLPIEDVRANIRAEVAAGAATWLRMQGVVVAKRLAAPERPRGSESRLPWTVLQALPWGLMCAAQPDQAEALLLGVVERAALESGEPSTRRAATIARLEAELRELEAADEATTDAAIGAGVVVEHRPEIAEARLRAARAKQLEEERIRDAAARHRRLDADHAQRTRRVLLDPEAGGSRSKYIQSGGESRP